MNAKRKPKNPKQLTISRELVDAFKEVTQAVLKSCTMIVCVLAIIGAGVAMAFKWLDAERGFTIIGGTLIPLALRADAERKNREIIKTTEKVGGEVLDHNRYSRARDVRRGEWSSNSESDFTPDDVRGNVPRVDLPDRGRGDA